jgi:hypothetical protein
MTILDHILVMVDRAVILVRNSEHSGINSIDSGIRRNCNRFRESVGVSGN